MAKKKRKGGKHGRCNVTADREKLRISIPTALYNGRQCYVYTGLDDTTANRGRAALVAEQMELDIHSRRFDLSRERYKALVRIEQAAVANQDNYQGNIPGVHIEKLADLFSQWVDSLHLTEEKLNTHYKWTLGLIEKHKPHWQDTSWVKKVNLAAITINNYLSYIRSSIDWGLRKGLIKGDNPYNRVSASSTEGETKTKGFSKKEKAQILNAFKDDLFVTKLTKIPHSYYYPMLLLWLNTGLRTGELIGLRWKDVDWENQKLWITHSLSKDRSNAGNGHRLVDKKTKTGVKGWLPITPPIEKALKLATRRHRGRDALIFPAPDGAPLNVGSFNRNAWKKVLLGLGIPHQPTKNIRHTVLTEAVNTKGIGMTGAMRIARHRSMRMIATNYGQHVEKILLPSSPEVDDDGGH